jgi:hypothetical protein
MADPLFDTSIILLNVVEFLFYSSIEEDKPFCIGSTGQGISNTSSPVCKQEERRGSARLRCWARR